MFGGQSGSSIFHSTTTTLETQGGVKVTVAMKPYIDKKSNDEKLGVENRRKLRLRDESEFNDDDTTTLTLKLNIEGVSDNHVAGKVNVKKGNVSPSKKKKRKLVKVQTTLHHFATKELVIPDQKASGLHIGT